MIKNNLFILCALVLIFSCRESSLGQDILVIKRDGQTTKRSGTIVDWQGKKISILTGSRTRSINSDDVVELLTVWPDELITARKSVQSKDYNTAIRQFTLALSDEKRSWVKVIILSEQIQALDAVENLSLAAVQFLKLIELDPNSRFFNLIPLSWSVGEIKPPTNEQCKTWLASDNPVALLTGASWQLQYNSQAVDVLESLANYGDKRIAQLATAQLWRKRQSSATETDLQRWSQQMVRLPVELQAGPLIVLADVQKKLGASEQAQINLLKLPILYPQKKSLSAFALFRCGTIMDDSGTHERAVGIWRELIRDFPTSQFAEFAKGKF